MEDKILILELKFGDDPLGKCHIFVMRSYLHILCSEICACRYRKIAGRLSNKFFLGLGVRVRVRSNLGGAILEGAIFRVPVHVT